MFQSYLGAKVDCELLSKRKPCLPDVHYCVRSNLSNMSPGVLQNMVGTLVPAQIMVRFEP